MKRRQRQYRVLLAGITALALAIPSVAVLGQDKDAAPPEPAGTPRNIVPLSESPAPEIMPDAMPDMPVRESMPAPVLRSNASPVQVGELGALEGPLAGTLDQNSGSLGVGEWQGSDRTTMVTMIQAAPAATSSATQHLLMRKLLLTSAPPPPGRANGSFNQVRLTKLLDGGYLDDAAALALKMQEPNNFDLLRTQTDALLYSGRENDACSDLTAHRLDSAEPFWVELRAFCYALTNDSGPLEITRAVITEQGIADPAFVTLLDDWASGKPVAPDLIRYPDSIHIAMLVHLKLPMTREIATDIGLAGSLIAAASAATAAELRILAAEKALRSGQLPEPVLEQVLDLTTFSPQELDGAPALARVEPLMKALARLRAAVRTARAPEPRAELIHTAFEIAEREGVLRQVALLFAEPAAAIMPAPDWARWSDLMTRGLLLAGRPEAAQRWLDILDPAAPGNSVEAGQLELAFALAAPNPRRAAEARRVLTDLADALRPKEDPAAAMPIDMPADMPPTEKPAPKPSPEMVQRAVFDLGIFDAAAGALIPQGAGALVQPLMKDVAGGRRPADVLMQRIDRAALADARGEVALSVIAALGDKGPADLAPDVVVRLVRALETASMRDAAQMLAQEAFLLRPATAAAR